jgi:hypothetical protein
MPVTINPASKITAGQWVAMIQKSQYIPQYLKQGNGIPAAPERLAF